MVAAASTRQGHQGATEAQQDPARLERLFVTHYRWVWRTLRRLGVPERSVDDAAQQVFMIAAARLSLIEEAKEASFLMGVSIRLAANARRSEARRRVDSATDTLWSGGGEDHPEALLEWKQRREKLDRWLAVLAPELRVPFVLFELDGLSLAEISALLELPLGTVKTRLRRARSLFLEATKGDSR